MGKPTYESPPTKSDEFLRELRIYIPPFVLWAAWMFTGTAYYAVRNNLGWAKGFYMAVNVGYSIGWGFPIEIDQYVEVFSITYLLLGATAVGTALAFYVRSMIVSSKAWYVRALEREHYRNDKRSLRKVYDWMKMRSAGVRAMAFWFVWVAAMCAFSCIAVGWNAIDGLYYAVSTLSTGGLWAVPQDSPDYVYVVTGVFAATGIPLMGLAMASLASLMVSFGDHEATNRAISSRITRKELKMMTHLGLEDGDGRISRAEFIILCSVRIGALSPDVAHSIVKRFKELDYDNTGYLDQGEVIEEGHFHEMDAPGTRPGGTNPLLNFPLDTHHRSILSQASGDADARTGNAAEARSASGTMAATTIDSGESLGGRGGTFLPYDYVRLEGDEEERDRFSIRG